MAVSILQITSIICIAIAVIIGVLNSDTQLVNEMLAHSALSNFYEGVLCLQFEEEDGRTIAYGEVAVQGAQVEAAEVGCTQTVLVHNKKEVYSAFLRSTIGIGESYFNGHWTLPPDGDLGDFLTFLFWNMLTGSSAKYGRYFEYFSVYWWQEYFYITGVAKDQKQDMLDVCEHYFSSDFYAKVLDETMTYTSGIWNSSITCLKEAQYKKMDLMLYKLRLPTAASNKANATEKEVVQVLDIGTGWGFFASYIYNVSNRNSALLTNVTGITISRAQYNYAVEMFGHTGPHFEFLDFRELPAVYGDNHFHRVVAVGIMCHIHIKRLDEYFEVAYRVLKPGGSFVMQEIAATTAFANGYPAWFDRNYACQESVFIYKYVFPGTCMLLGDWIHESAVRAGFITMHRDYIGHHYSRTLRHWQANLLRSHQQFLDEDLATEKVFRSFEMYLAQAEAGFRIGKFEQVQMVFYKPLKDKVHTRKFEVYEDEVQLGWENFQL